MNNISREEGVFLLNKISSIMATVITVAISYIIYSIIVDFSLDFVFIVGTTLFSIPFILGSIIVIELIKKRVRGSTLLHVMIHLVTGLVISLLCIVLFKLYSATPIMWFVTLTGSIGSIVYFIFRNLKVIEQNKIVNIIFGIIFPVVYLICLLIISKG